MPVHQKVAGRKVLEAEVGAAGSNKTVLLCTQKAFNLCTKEGDEGMQELIREAQLQQAFA